nr:MAG TPA: zinc finger protein [Caudoviricetes sp.]
MRYLFVYRIFPYSNLNAYVLYIFSTQYVLPQFSPLNCLHCDYTLKSMPSIQKNKLFKRF